MWCKEDETSLCLFCKISSVRKNKTPPLIIMNYYNTQGFEIVYLCCFLYYGTMFPHITSILWLNNFSSWKCSNFLNHGSWINLWRHNNLDRQHSWNPSKQKLIRPLDGTHCTMFLYIFFTCDPNVLFSFILFCDLTSATF